MNKFLKILCCFLFLIFFVNLGSFAQGVSLYPGYSVSDISKEPKGFWKFWKKKKPKKIPQDKEKNTNVAQDNRIENSLEDSTNIFTNDPTTDKHVVVRESENNSEIVKSKNDAPIRNFDDSFSSILVCRDSLESYRVLLDILKEANWSIDMSLCMCGGSIFREIMTTVKERMSEAEHLTVYLMAEPIFFDDKDYAVIDEMKKEFSDRLFIVWTDFSPTTLPGMNVYQRHIKSVVVDERYFVIGGTNFEDLMCTKGESYPENVDPIRKNMFMNRPLAFRDQDIVGCSEKTSKELREEFHNSFRLWEHFALTRVFIKDPKYFKNDNHYSFNREVSSCIVSLFHENPDVISVDSDHLELVVSGPQYKEDESPITNKYIDLITKAEKEILISNLYFLPVPPLLNALVNRANDKISLEIIGNGRTDVSPGLVEIYCWGNRYNYTALLFGRTFYLWEKNEAYSLSSNTNVNIYDFYVPETQLHKKVMIVDEEIFVIGSYNFCIKSNNIDQELILVISSPEVAKRAKEVFEKDKSLSKKISREEILDWHFNLYYQSQGFIQNKYMPA